MAKSGKGGAPDTRTLLGADRYRRATERLAEARQQLAALEQHLADGASQIEAAAAMERSAARDVEQAERQADQAAAALIENQAALLIADGTPEEAATRVRHGELEQAHTAARQALDEARATLASMRERAQAEKVAIDGAAEELKAQRRDVTRLVQSLERAVETARELQGHDLLDELKARHLELVSLRDQAQAAADAADVALRASLKDAAAQLTPWPDRLAEAAEAGVAPNERDALEAVYGAFSAYLDAFEHGQGVLSHPPYVSAPIRRLDPKWMVTLADALALDKEELNALLHSTAGAPRILAEQRRKLRVVRGEADIMEDVTVASAVRQYHYHYDDHGHPVSPEAKLGLASF